jgi:hypothetical protein
MEPPMKLLELMSQLGLWPFDSDTAPLERKSTCDHGHDEPLPILLPKDLGTVVHAAQWPTEYQRRTLH